MEATLTTICKSPDCLEAIHKGEEIKFDPEYGWVHEDCAGSSGRLKRGQVCPRCFIEMSLDGYCSTCDI